MRSLARPAAIWLAGFVTFLDLYAPQSILPLVRDRFGASAVEASHLISASTLAVALIAPFTGAAADMVGRKRVIAAAMFALVVPTAMVAFSDSLAAMVFWRFVQGLLLPPVFVVTVAYIGDELAPHEATSMAGIYMSASCFGGFFGRFASGLLAGPYGLRGAFFGIAALTLVAASGFALLLPRERRFVASAGAAHALRHMLGHLLDHRLFAIFAVGFAVLFSFVAMFTYVSFYLAAPPFSLSPAALGSVFVIYLVGVITTPLAGRLIRRLGRRGLVMATSGLWIASLLLTLTGSLPLIIVGLALGAGCGFFSQTAATSYVAVSAQRARSSAVGLYVTWYYIGGSAGAIVPGFAWNAWGWPGCVAVIALVQLAAGLIVARFWRETHTPPPGSGVAA